MTVSVFLFPLNPSVSRWLTALPVAITDCFPLWLKTCHWHVFLTRRAYEGEPQLLSLPFIGEVDST